jgi:hypothetical protein
MSNVGMLQLALKLEKGATLLLVFFFKHGVVLDVASQPHWIIWGGMGGNRLQAAFNSANMVVAVMVRAVTMPIVGKWSLTVQNATAWVAYGDTINDEHTAFLCPNQT